CALAAPAAYSAATAAVPHRGAIPTAGPSEPRADVRTRSTLLQAAPAGPEMVRLLRTDADEYTWAAATIGSNPAAGLQLSAGLPVMAVGGYNGTDPFPALDRFRNMVAEGKIHYFVSSPADAFSLLGTIDPLLPIPALTGPPVPAAGAGTPAAPWIPLPGTRPAPRTQAHSARQPSPEETTAAGIAAWVAGHYPAQEVGGLAVYDLSVPPRPHTPAAPEAGEEVP